MFIDRNKKRGGELSDSTEWARQDIEENTSRTSVLCSNIIWAIKCFRTSNFSVGKSCLIRPPASLSRNQCEVPSLWSLQTESRWRSEREDTDGERKHLSSPFQQGEISRDGCFYRESSSHGFKLRKNTFSSNTEVRPEWFRDYKQCKWNTIHSFIKMSSFLSASYYCTSPHFTRLRVVCWATTFPFLHFPFTKGAVWRPKRKMSQHFTINKTKLNPWQKNLFVVHHSVPH